MQDRYMASESESAVPFSHVSSDRAGFWNSDSECTANKGVSPQLNNTPEYLFLHT